MHPCPLLFARRTCRRLAANSLPLARSAPLCAGRAASTCGWLVDVVRIADTRWYACAACRLSERGCGLTVFLLLLCCSSACRAPSAPSSPLCLTHAAGLSSFSFQFRMPRSECALATRAELFATVFSGAKPEMVRFLCSYLLRCAPVRVHCSSFAAPPGRILCWSLACCVPLHRCCDLPAIDGATRCLFVCARLGTPRMLAL